MNVCYVIWISSM